MLFGLLIATAGNSLMAQEVNIDVAQNRALDFLSKQIVGTKHAKGASDALMPTLAYTSKSEGRTCFYVFNAGDDAGFVIVGGDEAAQEILGYCDHGTFNYDTAPENLKWWLSQYTEQISYAAKVGVAGSRRAKAETTSRVAIDPLIKTKWDQRNPYNRKIVASDNTTGFVTGCVATAMAQVMNKWKCPTSQGQGSHSYTYGGHTFSADFSTTTYDWNNMLDKYEYSDNGTPKYSDDQANAVATLMYHAGVSVDMQYGTNESGANSTFIGYALATYFGYDKAVRNEFREYYNDEDWEDRVYQELLEGHPVLYSGQAENGGHQFICDGYDKSREMFTINWGWSGLGDGSYLLTGAGALQPDFNGTGGGGEGSAYTGGQMIIIGVKPDAGGSEDAHFGQLECPNNLSMYLKVGNTTYEDNYNYDRSVGNIIGHLYSSLVNRSCISTNFDYGVKAVNTNDENKIYYSVSASNVSLQRNNYYIDNLTDQNPIAYDLPFNPSNWDEGIYELRPVCRLAGQTDDDWIEVDKLLDETYPTITVTGEPSTAEVILLETPYFSNDNNPYEDDMKLHFKVKNNTDRELTVYFIYKITIGTSIYYRGVRYTNVSASDVIDSYLSLDNFIDQLTIDQNYTIEFYSDESFNVPYNYPSINFTYRDKLSVNYGVSPANWGTLILPFDADLPEDMTVYSCEDYDENGVLKLVEETNIERNIPYIVQANYGTDYSFSGPKAIDSDKPTFATGVLVGAVTDNVPLVSGTDYILQYQNDEAAFYQYMGNPSGRKAAQFRAFLRLDSSSDVTSYALPRANEGEGIEFVKDEELPAGIYSIDGNSLTKFQKGMNVIIYEDGTSLKVFVK